MEKIHPSDTSISCDKCNLIRATETDLVKHILNRHPGLAKIKIHGIIVDSNSNKEGEVDKKEKQILCQFCRSPYDDRFLYRMHLYEKHCKDIIQSFKEGIAEEQEKPAFPCPHCDTIIRTNETGLTIHIGKAHPDQCCAKVKSKRKEEDKTTRQSRKKRAPRKANNVQRKVSGTLLESSDDDCNGSDEDPHNNADNNTNEHPSRRSLRTKCPTRRYIDDKLSENILNREKRQARLTEQKKVVVPSSPMKFTKFEKNLLEKYPSVKWKGNPAVVLERLILVKTEVL
ncbi:Valine--tRNA ligase [Orchesella cincta]|uniref:Valine--tRNA ligase n=1 Tax=Orchesella cincta TaxID=48709 RepID=A0A1D2MQN7_ORCCI|nr:Valine--tRNA ligase [Orchesella cincta]